MSRRQPVFIGVVVVLAVATATIVATRGVVSVGGAGGNRRQGYFRGEVVAVVDEVVVPSAIRGAAERVVRSTRLDAGGTTSLTVDLDGDGIVVAAEYVRPGERSVAWRAGRVVVDGRPGGSIAGPVVLLELLHRLRLTAPRQVTLLELSSLERQRVTIQRQGPAIVALADGVVVARALPEGLRTGPGAFAEGDAPTALPGAPVDIPVEGLSSVAGLHLGRGAPRLAPLDVEASDAHRRPGPFIESDADVVVAFARPLCRADVLETARLVGEAVHDRVDARATAVAPGAVRMLLAGGDCDGAAALATAALRACGHPARALVGYRLLDAGTQMARLVPHALTEVYRGAIDGTGTPGRWWRLDATVNTLTDVDDRFVAVAEGLGGSLTMGRVLGVVDRGDLVSVDAGTPGEPDAHP